MLIYHTSDLHDHRGIAQPLDAMRARDPGLLFDCGDSLRGSQTVYFRREPIIEEMDRAGYDAQAMGNREFHYLFGAVKARIGRMRHPVVCSNLVDTKRRALPFRRLYDLEYRPPGDGVPAVRVHLLGLLIMQYPERSAWERIFGWRFLNPLTVVREAVQGIPDDEPLIVLSHLGLSLDRKLADAVGRITLLLGGHSHDTLYTPEIVNGVPIVHAGPYGRYVSRSQLQYHDGRWRLQGSALVPLISP